MTMSLKACSIDLGDGRNLNAFWNTDGTIGMDTVRKGVTKFSEMLPGEWNWVCLKPLEIEQLLTEKRDMVFDGIRPGLFPMHSRIEVFYKEGIFEIKERDRVLRVSLEHLTTVLESSREVWGGYKGIRPLIGDNCVGGSFDAMAGDLSQHKKNEEHRVIAKDFIRRYKDRSPKLAREESQGPPVGGDPV